MALWKHPVVISERTRQAGVGVMPRKQWERQEDRAARKVSYLQRDTTCCELLQLKRIAMRSATHIKLLCVLDFKLYTAAFGVCSA